MNDEIYRKLATHLASLGMGYPEKEELLEILRLNFTPLEAEVALAIPAKRIPLDIASVREIATHSPLPKPELERVLEHLSQRGLIFSGKMMDGTKGYCLQQFGYGFPQTFFWRGVHTPHSKKLAELIVRYSGTETLHEIYGQTKTKAFRYVPAMAALEPESHAVFPFEMMEQLIARVKRIALVHCPCRSMAQVLGKKRCAHPLETCIKYDDLADYLIETGIGKEITKQEALAVIKRSEEAGLVHLVDNAQEGIKHTCNCCGCCCWSVGTISRRRIPRDILMATYYLRETDAGRCSGCGQCVEICPVRAIKMEADRPAVDREWCIGCGVCAVVCPSAAVQLIRRPDIIPPKDFKELQGMILKERGNSGL